MSDDPKPFIWAHDVQANVKEPIQALKEQGWRYGDVPTASNFNWIFKTMTEEIVKLKNELVIQKESCDRAIAQQNANSEKLLTKIKKLSDEVNYFDELQRYNAMQLSRSIEATWDLLRKLNPTIPWPSVVFSKGPANLTS